MHDDATPLESVLMSHVERELERLGVQSSELSPLREKVRQILHNPALTDREREFLSTVDGSLGAVLNSRVERAIQAAVMMRLHEEGRAEVEYEPPQVHIVDESAAQESPQEMLSRTMRTDEEATLVTLGRTLLPIESETGRGTLVLADEQLMEALEAQRTGAYLHRLPDPPPELQGRELELLATAGIASEVRDLEATLQVDLDDEEGGGARSVPGPPGQLRSSPKEWVGRVFGGQYEVRRVIGEGGFATVFEAFDRELLTSVAIKVVRPEAVRSRQDLDNFKKEAHRVTQLQHPNIIEWKVLAKTRDGTPYFVMEFLEGEELEELLCREGRLEPARAQQIMFQVLSGLRAAHHLEAGNSILHLDLKPKNIFLTKNRRGEEVVKVIDFGIGQFVTPDSLEGASDRIPSTHGRLAADLASGEGRRGSTEGLEGRGGPGTPSASREKATPRTFVTRSVGCTPEYASPEQCGHMLPNGEILPLDLRSDLYSFGVVFFQALTGELPFAPPRSGNRREYLRLHREEEPRKVGSLGAKVPRRLARFVDQCLVKDRSKRWATTDDAYRELEQIVNPRATGKVVAAFVALFTVFAALLLHEMSKEPEESQRFVLGSGSSVYSQAMPLAVRWDSPVVELDVSQYTGDLTAGTSCEINGEGFEGWSATVSETDTGAALILEAPEDAEPGITRDVWFSFEDGTSSWRSENIGLVYIAENSWGLEDARLEAAGEPLESLVDPRGLVAEFIFRGDPALIRKVQIKGEKTLEVAKLARSGAELACRFALSDVCRLERCKQRLSFVVIDIAGGSAEHSVGLSTVVQSLDAATSLSPGDGLVPGDGAHLAYPGSAHGFSVEASYPVEYSWGLHSGGSVVSSMQREPLDGRAEIALDLAVLGQGRIDAEVKVTFHERVSRQAEPATHVLTLPLIHDTATPQYQVYVKGYTSDGKLRDVKVEADGSSAQPLAFADGPIRVEVNRQNSIPAEAMLTATGPDGQVVQSLRRHDVGTAALDFEWSPDVDGVHLLNLGVGTYRAGGAAAAEAEFTPDSEASFSIVLDRVDPIVRRKSQELVVVLPKRTAEIVLELQDQSSPLRVEYYWPDERPVPEFLLLRQAEPGEMLFEIPVGEGDADGRYDLEIQVRDVAGRVSETLEVPVEVARSGPDFLQLELPSGREWLADSAGSFSARASASDLNDVEEVRLLLEAVGDALEPSRLELALEPGDARQWSFHGRLSGWGGRDARLSLSAADPYGNSVAKVIGEVHIKDVETLTPAVVEWSMPGDQGVALGRMIKVDGNHADTYFFGGRDADTEADAHRQLYGESLDMRSDLFKIQREYRARQIPSYYLDEREVTVAEFLHFLEDYEAVAAEASKIATAAGSDWRPRPLEQLRAVVSAQPTDVAVTGISWFEASLFARWAGKRLPSLLELEYAIRGGSAHYRFHSMFSTAEGGSIAQRLAAHPQLRVRPDSAARDWAEPGAARTSPDRSPEGLLDLCTNVSEWTSSPSGAVDEQLGIGESMPDTRTKLFVSGANYRTSNQFDFMGYWSLHGSRDKPVVGFRCALDHAEVVRLLDDADGRKRLGAED